MTTLVPSINSVNGTPFIVASEVMQKFMTIVERVARHVGSVLVVGETGAGKELIARTIHERSTRLSKPFVEINCAALPENLVESELFGYEKGAFSGADTDKAGLFELAHSGTIFLDEIGELDLRIQVKLLRILDRAPYYRLGGHRKIAVDVRVVAATNRNLKEEVNAGRFRKDLYHRLTQFEICVPPLRERPEDIVALGEHFLAQASGDHKFSPEALRMLQTYSWPGNVRELQNVVNRIWVSCSGSEIKADDVSRELTSAQASDPVSLENNAQNNVEGPEPTTHLESLEARAIKTALEKTGGHQGEASKHLGISRRTLSRKLREYGFASTRRVARVALGSLSHQQQRCFRAEVKMPVELETTDGRQVTCTANNLSTDGMGVEGLTAAFDHNCEMRVRFRLPESDTTMDVPARLAWGGARGRAGITFQAIDPTASEVLKRWLCQKMAEEGWTVQPEPLAEQLNG